MTSSHTSNSADISSQRRLWREGLTRTTLSGLERSCTWLRVGLCCVALSFFLSECLEYSCNRLTMRIDGSIMYFGVCVRAIEVIDNSLFFPFLFLSLCSVVRSVVLYACDFSCIHIYIHVRDSNSADMRS